MLEQITSPTDHPSPARARIRAMEAGDKDEVCRLIEQHLGRRINRKEWERLFTYDWNRDVSDYGLVVEAHGRIVGFCGTVHAQRSIGQTCERFCNITSLCVDPPYRAMAPLLILSAARKCAATVTFLTPNGPVSTILEKAGLSVLDSSRLFVFPTLNVSSLTHGLPRFEDDPRRFRAQLDEEQKRIVDDHVPYGCLPMLVRRKDTACLLIVKRRIQQINVKKIGIPVSEILFASDPKFLAKHIESIVLRLTIKQKTLAVSCGSRQFGGNAPRAISITEKCFFRSRTLTREQIDGLYSEFVLLPI